MDKKKSKLLLTELLFEEENDEPRLEFDSELGPYVYKIPKGYRWCEHCEALTPQEWGYSQTSHCKICHSFNSGICVCPNCGAEEEELGPESVDIHVHHEGCHFQDEKPEDGMYFHSFYASHAEKILYEFIKSNKGLPALWIKEQKALECGCPRYKVFRHLNIYNYTSGSYYSQDCMNAIEWSYDRRCPICGLVYFVSDSNC